MPGLRPRHPRKAKKTKTTARAMVFAFKGDGVAEEGVLPFLCTCGQ
jgi:hypothetical protein